jgi:hypothetical protein
MIRDTLWQFAGSSHGATGGIVTGATFPTSDSPTTGTQYSSNVIDIGLSGLQNSVAGGGARDLGVGDDPALKVQFIVTQTFLSGTSLQLAIQGAPDNGSGAPGAYTTMWQSQAILEANLVAATAANPPFFQLGNIDFPRVAPGQPLPRFLRVQYTTVGTHTAGALTAEVVLDRDDQIISSTGYQSGYPAGITIAN